MIYIYIYIYIYTLSPSFSDLSLSFYNTVCRVSENITQIAEEHVCLSLSPSMRP